MTRRLLVGGLAVAITLVLLGSVIAVALAVFGTTTVAGPTATLAVFTGSTQLQKAGSATAATGRTGDPVGNGDVVSTGPESKAAIRYPDGSVTRLDSLTKVTVVLARAGTKGFKMGVSQAAGLTWNTVTRLVNGSTFNVTGPNNAAAGVRGTRFGFYIEHDVTGQTVVWIDVYDGVVGVKGAVGPEVRETANQRVNVRAGAAPTAPVPIPDSDRHLSFTVFNQTLESVTGGPIAFRNGNLSSGQTAGPYPVTADGKSTLEFTLGWPGSIFELTVIDPSGKVFSKPAATTTPIKVSVPKAAAGTWQFSVRDVNSLPLEPWWVIVTRS